MKTIGRATHRLIADDCRHTGGNYHIVKRQRSYTQFINDKIEALDLPTKVRKDAVLMCSFVVGSDGAFFKNLSPQEQEKFFAECTRFFAERYGEGNIISAIVHTDETTPHLHLNLIPIAGGRLCAKKLFDRKALTALQTDLYREGVQGEEDRRAGARRSGQYHCRSRP